MVSNTKSKLSPMLFLIVMLSIVLAIGVEGYWDIEELGISYKEDQVDLEFKYTQMHHDLLEYQFSSIESVLEVKYKQSYIGTQHVAKALGKDIKATYQGREEELIYDLEHVGLDTDFVALMGKYIKGLYFDNIESDANDMFALIIDPVAEDSEISSDFSLNCSAFGRGRSIDEEVTMHVADGDPILAREAMMRIATGNIPNFDANIFDHPIIFQFAGNSKKGGWKHKFVEYDMDEFREAFYELDGDWETLFIGYEFITPVYLYPQEDLVGRVRIANGTRQESKVVAINGVFSFYEVLMNIPKEVEKQAIFAERISQLETVYNSTTLQLERTYNSDVRFRGISLILLMLLVGTLFIIATHRRGAKGE